MNTDQRDLSLTWVTVEHPLLGDLDVGVVYYPAIPARPTSAYTYVMTGNPGDTGEEAMCEVLDVREACNSDLSVVHVLSDVALGELRELALAQLERSEARKAA